MGDDKIRVNTWRLGTDIGQIEGCIHQMRSELSKLQNTARELDAMWDGVSSEAFKKAFYEDMNALTTILDNLNRIYEYEKAAREKYESCEKKVTELVSGLRV